MSSRRITHANLGDFIERLSAAGELVRISEKVSPILEITEIADRVSKSGGGGKALLFENVEGSKFPVLINGFGSDKRMAMALGADDIEEIATQIDALLNMSPPESFMDKLGMLPTLLEMAKFPPRKISGEGECQEVVHTGNDADLGILPALKCWPQDAGRFITFPLVFSEGLDGRRNLGMYRMQIFDKNRTGMHWHIHKDGAHQFHEYRKAGKKMPVSVAIGSDPVVTYAATAPLPRGIDELLLAGLIRKKPVTLVKCKTNDLWVPADAEIVLEGYVDPQEDFVLEGPFGDHTGYYSLADYYPVFHVTAITHRKNPVYFTTIVGKPPMEDCYMAGATGRIFLPMLRKVVPEVKDYDLPWEGVFHNCVLIALEKEFPASAHRAMNALWGTGQMSFAKMILALDEDVELTDYRNVFNILLNNLDLERDLFFSEGVLDVLDHSAPEPLRGSKLGIDATSRVKGEEPRKNPGLDKLSMDIVKAECDRLGIKACKTYGEETINRLLIISVEKNEPGEARGLAEEMLSGPVGRMVNIILAVDGNIDPANGSVVTWKFFNNTDPKRDIVLSGPGLLIDATKKVSGEGHEREWPDDIEMDPLTKEKIDALWPKLGL